MHRTALAQALLQHDPEQIGGTGAIFEWHERGGGIRLFKSTTEDNENKRGMWIHASICLGFFLHGHGEHLYHPISIQTLIMGYHARRFVSCNFMTLEEKKSFLYDIFGQMSKCVHELALYKCTMCITGLWKNSTSPAQYDTR